MARVLAVALEVMDRPWCWGEADCCTAACDVFARLHGVDPMAPLRGRYHSGARAARLIAQWGGWLAMGDGLAERAGLVRVACGQPGDIGIIRDAQGALALGIRTERGWAGKTRQGMALGHMEMRAWTCRQ